MHALIAPNPESSFFSDHTIVATGCAIGALLVSRRWGVVAIAAGAAVGLARVAVGAHYPTDVLTAVAVTTLATVMLLPTRPKLTIAIGKLFRYLPASIAGRSTAIRPSRAGAG